MGKLVLRKTIVRNMIDRVWAALEDPARLHLIFTCFYFATILFYRVRSSALRQTPNLEDQVSVFMSLCDRVAQLYPQAPGSLFVAFYDSQGYGGVILTRLHTGRDHQQLES
jgi:hypothetical protein